MNALDVFHTTVQTIVTRTGRDWREVQAELLDRMIVERPTAARTVFNALMAEMTAA